MIRRLPAKQKNLAIRRERDRSLPKKLAALLLCGLVLASGFLYAARQHFRALDLGYQSENLRSERKRLLEDQNRLLLLREQAAAPARLEREARRIGLQAVQPGQVAAPMETKSVPERNAPAAAPATNNSSVRPANNAGAY